MGRPTPLGTIYTLHAPWALLTTKPPCPYPVRGYRCCPLKRKEILSFRTMDPDSLSIDTEKRERKSERNGNQEYVLEDPPGEQGRHFR